MKIGTVNYEALMKNFKFYNEAKETLNKMHQDYLTKMEFYKDQMETLYKTSTSLLLDEQTQAANQKKFMDLQKEASKYQQETSKKMSDRQTKEMEGCYDQLTKVVGAYSEANKIDLVLSNTSILYSGGNLDITENILNEFKNLDLYVEEVLEETV